MFTRWVAILVLSISRTTYCLREATYHCWRYSAASPMRHPIPMILIKQQTNPLHCRFEHYNYIPFRWHCPVFRRRLRYLQSLIALLGLCCALYFHWSSFGGEWENLLKSGERCVRRDGGAETFARPGLLMESGAMLSYPTRASRSCKWCSLFYESFQLIACTGHRVIMWDSRLFKAICSSDVGSDDGAAMEQRGRKVRVMPLHRTPFFFLFF